MDIFISSVSPLQLSVLSDCVKSVVEQLAILLLGIWLNVFGMGMVLPVDTLCWSKGAQYRGRLSLRSQLLH